MTYKEKLTKWIENEMNNHGLIHMNVFKVVETTDEEAFCEELLRVIHAPKHPCPDFF